MDDRLPPDPVTLLKDPLLCPACGSRTVTVMQVDTIFDRLARAAWYVPLLCRICHNKFYRRIRKELEEIARGQLG